MRNQVYEIGGKVPSASFSGSSDPSGRSAPASKRTHTLESELNGEKQCKLRVIGARRVCQEIADHLSRVGFICTGFEPLKENPTVFRMYLFAEAGRIMWQKLEGREK